jgi:hypothetical protein
MFNLPKEGHMGKDLLKYLKGNLTGSNTVYEEVPEEYYKTPSIFAEPRQEVLSAEIDPSGKGVSFEILKKIGRKNLKKAKAWVDSGGRPSDIAMVLDDVKLDDETRKMISKGDEGLESYLERRIKKGKTVNDKYLVGEYLTNLIADPLYKYMGRKHPDGTNLSETFNKLNESLEGLKRYGQRKKFKIVPDVDPSGISK